MALRWSECSARVPTGKEEENDGRRGRRSSSTPVRHSSLLVFLLLLTSSSSIWRSRPVCLSNRHDAHRRHFLCVKGRGSTQLFLGLMFSFKLGFFDQDNI